MNQHESYYSAPPRPLSQNLRNLIAVCLTVSLSLIYSATEAASFEWPDFQAELEPSQSVSSIKAPTPSLMLEPALPDASDERSKFNGSWEGWACRYKVVDLKIVISKVSKKGAEVGYAVASEEYNIEPTYFEKSARFKRDVLRLKLNRGVRVFFGLREDGNLNYKWQNRDGFWCTGILNRTEFAQ